VLKRKSRVQSRQVRASMATCLDWTLFRDSVCMYRSRRDHHSDGPRWSINVLECSMTYLLRRLPEQIETKCFVCRTKGRV
jgi:hypothetical protein